MALHTLSISQEIGNDVKNEEGYESVSPAGSQQQSGVCG